MHSEIKEQVTIELDEPIKRGDGEINTLTIRRPKSGALRGVSLLDLINMHVIALQVVLPRITTPALTAKDVAELDPADLMSIGSEVAFFLASKADRAPGLPHDIEEAMADIAAIFHWTPAAMDDFEIVELMRWRERARERSGAE